MYLLSLVIIYRTSETSINSHKNAVLGPVAQWLEQGTHNADSAHLVHHRGTSRIVIFTVISAVSAFCVYTILNPGKPSLRVYVHPFARLVYKLFYADRVAPAVAIIGCPRPACCQGAGPFFWPLRRPPSRPCRRSSAAWGRGPGCVRGRRRAFICGHQLTTLRLGAEQTHFPGKRKSVMKPSPSASLAALSGL